MSRYEQMELSLDRRRDMSTSEELELLTRARASMTPSAEPSLLEHVWREHLGNGEAGKSRADAYRLRHAVMKKHLRRTMES